MERFAFFCFISLWASLPIEAAADDTAYLVARDFTAGNEVLELDVPTEIDGTRFFFIFENSYSERGLQVAVARAGRHSYELRDLPEWRGPIKYLAISLKGVASRLKEPTLADDIDIFLEPERITPATVNMLIQHKLFAWSWTTCLLLVFIAVAIFARTFKKKPIPLALGAAFVLTWALMDLRLVFDHATIVYKEETLHEGMPPMTDVKQFADQASGVIGRSPWAAEPLDFGANFLNYRLAEQPYAPSGSAITPSFWVTNNPAGRPFVLQHEKYYLVKKEKP